MAAKRSSKKSSTRKSPRPKARSTSRKVSKRAVAKKKPARKPAKKATRKPAARSVGEDRVALIQRVLDVMQEAGAVEVEMEEAGSRIRVRMKEDAPATILTSHAPMAAAPAIPMVAPGQVGSAEAPAMASPAEPEGDVFLSPMVGTFYRAASPEAEFFVNSGDVVHEESTICIIEAMKVMNEIKAECEGQVVAILVENGEPVEFGQPLFRIKG